MSSIDSPPFRQSLITLNISSAVSSPCAQFSHMVLWSGMNGSIVRATMMSLGVCGSGPTGHITCAYGLYLSMVNILTANPIRLQKKESKDTIIGQE